MAKAGRWFRSFLGGKDKGDKEEEENKNGRQQCRQKQQPNNSPAPSPEGKEKRRWSFRRSTNTSKTKEPISALSLEAEDERARHAMAVAAATKAAADAAAAAAHAAAVVIRLTEAAKCRLNAAEGTAAVKIQSAFRSYLAKKALKALKGFVKLQALIRGQLVRRIITVQATERALRILMAKDAQKILMMFSQRRVESRRSSSPLDPRCRRKNDLRRNSLEKVLEMDLHGTKWSSRVETAADRDSPYHCHHHRRRQQQKQISPSASSLTEVSPMASSGHFEESSSFRTAETSTYYYSPMSSAHDSIKENACVVSDVYGSCPSYMAKTESSKAKARSHSTPRQRPSSPRRRSSIGSAVDGYQQWKDNSCKSLVPFEAR